MAHSSTGNRFRTRPEGFSTFDALHAAHNLSFMDKAATILADSPGEFYGYGAGLSASVLAAAQTSGTMGAIIFASTALTAAVRFPFIATKVAKSAENAWAGKPKETAEDKQGAWKKQAVRGAVTFVGIAALSAAGLFGAVNHQNNSMRSTPEATQAVRLIQSGITLKNGGSFGDPLALGSAAYTNVSISKRGDNSGSNKSDLVLSFDVPTPYTDVLTGRQENYRMSVGFKSKDVQETKYGKSDQIKSIKLKMVSVDDDTSSSSYYEGPVRRAAPIQQCIGPHDPSCK